MPRAPVLPSVIRAAQTSGSATFAGGQAPEPDGYAERLVKYIPGEVIPFFLPFASGESASQGRVIAALAVGEVVALLAALTSNERLEADARRPRGFVVLWSLLAFPAWALGTSAGTQDLVGWPALTCTLVLAAAALIIPRADDLLVGWVLERRRRRDG